MRLVTLGGAGAGPNAGQGCSGIYLECGVTRLVLDLGPGTLLELRRHCDFRSIDAVLISHLHIDHFLDLIAMYWGLVNNPIPLPQPIPVWLPPGGLQVLNGIADALADYGTGKEPFADVFSIAEYHPDEPLAIGDARISFAPTIHHVPCWAVRVAGSEGRDLVYTADSGPGAGLETFAMNAYILVAESTFFDIPPDQEGEFRGSMTAAEAATLATTIHATVLVLTHLWQERGIKRIRESAAGVFDGVIEVAAPGLRIEW